MAMVLRAGKTSGVGGHIATYASATTLYETGYRHFFRAATPEFLGDMLYIQAIRRPASTRAPTWKAACRKTS